MPRGRQSLQSDGVHELPPPINPASPADREQQSFLVVYHQIVRHTHVPAANCPVFRQNLKLRFVNDEQQLVSRAPRMHGGPHGLYVTSILTPCFDGDVRFRPVCVSDFRAAADPALHATRDASLSHTHDTLLDLRDNHAGLVGCCGPVMLYGENAEKVHGGRAVDHCVKYTLYSMICLGGVVSGPTRKAIRDKYGLAAAPGCFANCGSDGGFCNPDCTTGTVPFVSELALIQEYRELEKQGQTWSSAKIAPKDFSMGMAR
jgi:Cys-rich protein (TIGR01571 family)